MERLNAASMESQRVRADLGTDIVSTKLPEYAGFNAPAFTFNNQNDPYGHHEANARANGLPGGGTFTPSSDFDARRAWMSQEQGM